MLLPEQGKSAARGAPRILTPRGDLCRAAVHKGEPMNVRVLSGVAAAVVLTINVACERGPAPAPAAQPTARPATESITPPAPASATPPAAPAAPAANATLPAEPADHGHDAAAHPEHSDTQHP